MQSSISNVNITTEIVYQFLQSTLHKYLQKKSYVSKIASDISFICFVCQHKVYASVLPTILLDYTTILYLQSHPFITDDFTGHLIRLTVPIWAALPLFTLTRGNQTHLQLQR